MPPRPCPRLAFPPSRAVIALIAFAFVAPGLVGHDPWRAFDVIAIEIAREGGKASRGNARGGMAPEITSSSWCSGA